MHAIEFIKFLKLACLMQIISNNIESKSVTMVIICSQDFFIFFLNARNTKRVLILFILSPEKIGWRNKFE